MKLDFNKLTPVAFLIIFLLVIVIALALLGKKSQQVVVMTDGAKYSNGGDLKVKIQNLLADRICFSSCYPYYLEKNEGAWKVYIYQNCVKSNVTQNCVSSRETKTFEIGLPLIEKGMHRLAIPLCKNCDAGQGFTENDRVYSNEFEIK